jgi:hypothetical protein
MTAKRSDPTSPLVAAAEAFDDSLTRYATLTKALRKGSLESRHDLERASQALTEIAACEDDLGTQAQALMVALGAARDTQQTQSDLVQIRALEIQKRSQEYAALMGRFEAIGKDAAGLNVMAQAMAARRGTAYQTMQGGDLLSLLCDLDDLHERMAAVAATGDGLVTDARGGGFVELSREVESLRHQLLSARNKIGLLKEALGKAAPRSEVS